MFLSAAVSLHCLYLFRWVCICSDFVRGLSCGWWRWVKSDWERGLAEMVFGDHAGTSCEKHRIQFSQLSRSGDDLLQTRLRFVLISRLMTITPRLTCNNVDALLSCSRGSCRTVQNTTHWASPQTCMCQTAESVSLYNNIHSAAALNLLPSKSTMTLVS